MSNRIQLIYDERAVEDVLEEHCEHFLSLKFIVRQYRTPVGIIDIIAKSLQDPRIYYVIELKNGPIDSNAYVQSLRYVAWLNSEMAKDGKRLFVPLLIGSALKEDVSKICEYFGDNYYYWVQNIGKVFYRIFKFDVMNGVSFSWSNNVQAEHSKSLNVRYDHLESMICEIDRLEHDNMRILDFMEVQYKKPDPKISLVKSGDVA